MCVCVCVSLHVFILSFDTEGFFSLRFAFVEFSMPDSVPMALQYNGAMFGDRPVK